MDGENVGIVTPQVARRMAEDAELDLVEISPNAEPPVCKIMDLGKFKYEQQKREAQARKNQKVVETKEIKLRPVTDTHDYQVKLKSVLRFLAEGNKVKVTMRFRGREITHQELGRDILARMRADVEGHGKAEREPALDGKQMIMILAPA